MDLSYPDPDNVALLYIDNSNVFINAQKHSARLRNYLPNVQEISCRVDIGKLVEFACKNKTLISGKLYGSEPPALDTVWKAIRRKEIQVSTSKKSFDSKEKETDTSLTADAVEDIVQFRDEGHTRTFILFSGDRDMLPVVQKAQKFGWQVNVWAFKNTLSDGIARESRENPACVQILPIDDIFNEITFIETAWSETLRIPRERCFVLKFSNSPRQLEKAQLEEFVWNIFDKSSKLFRLPTRGLFLADNLYAVVICIREKYIIVSKDGTNNNNNKKPGDEPVGFDKWVWPKVKKLKKSLGEHCVGWETYVAHCQSRDPNLRELEVEDDYVPDENDEAVDDAAENDPDMIFQPVTQKVRKVHTKYSEPCSHRFRCKHGSKCSYTHSEHEKEFFKKNPQNPLQRYKYKSKYCTGGACQYRGKSNYYLCCYAHDIKEAWCLRCHHTGLHWTDECPLNQQQRRFHR